MIHVLIDRQFFDSKSGTVEELHGGFWHGRALMSREADGETTNSVRPTRLLKFTKIVTPRGYHDE